MTGFIRLIGFLILAIFAISILRTVIGLVAKLFTGGASSRASHPAPGPGNPPKVKAGGTLHRCPVCGRPTSESLAIKRTSGGEIHYYCSPDCEKRAESV